MAIGVASTKAIIHIAAIDNFARNFDGIALLTVQNKTKVNIKNISVQTFVQNCIEPEWAENSSMAINRNSSQGKNAYIDR